MFHSLYKVRVCLLLFFFVAHSNFSISQDTSKIEVIVIGYGNTIENAKITAIRNASEKVAGLFVSTKTQIKNNELENDIISSISSTAITSFNILKELKLPNQSFVLTVKIGVSFKTIDNIVTQNSANVKLNGSLFTLNIKQQILNEQSESDALSNTFTIIHGLMQESFNYSLNISQPKIVSTPYKYVIIPVEVVATANDNIEICHQLLIDILESVAMSNNEQERYKSIGKMFYTAKIEKNNETKTFFLRNQASLFVLNTFLKTFKFYAKSFEVRPSDDVLINNDLFKNNDHKNDTYFNFGNSEFVEQNNLRRDGFFFKKMNLVTLRFLKSKDIGGRFSRNVEISYEDLVKNGYSVGKNKYSVMPRGKVSYYKNGGIVLYENNGTGFAAFIPWDLKSVYWNTAAKAAESYVANGYTDWRLPTREDFKKFYNYLIEKNLLSLFSDINSDFYIGEERGTLLTWSFNFEHGIFETGKEIGFDVFLIRNF